MAMKLPETNLTETFLSQQQEQQGQNVDLLSAAGRTQLTSHGSEMNVVSALISFLPTLFMATLISMWSTAGLFQPILVLVQKAFPQNQQMILTQMLKQWPIVGTSYLSGALQTIRHQILPFFIWIWLPAKLLGLAATSLMSVSTTPTIIAASFMSWWMEAWLLSQVMTTCCRPLVSWLWNHIWPRGWKFLKRMLILEFWRLVWVQSGLGKLIFGWIRKVPSSSSSSVVSSHNSIQDGQLWLWWRNTTHFFEGTIRRGTEKLVKKSIERQVESSVQNIFQSVVEWIINVNI